jgi:hypothetical protein
MCSFIVFLSPLELPQQNQKQLGQSRCLMNISPTFFVAFLMVMEAAIHIGIGVGNQVLCFTLSLCQQAPFLFSGYETNYMR